MSQTKQPNDHSNTLPVNPPRTKQVALVTVTPTMALRLRRAGAGAAPFFATGTGLAGIVGATTGALAGETAVAGVATAAPVLPSRIAFNISCGESRGPAAATTGFASGFAAEASGAGAGEGAEAATAGAPPLARIAAMMSLVEPGFVAGAAGFGAAASGAAASETEAAAGAAAGAGLTAGASAAGADDAAAAFWARILARMSEVEGFFSSISIRFRRAGEERLNCTDQCAPTDCARLVTRGFWQHPFGLTTTRTESIWNFSEARTRAAFQRQESPHFER